MALLRPALLLALGVLLVTPQAAVGGGWWSYIDPSRSTVAPGQRVEVNESVFFGSRAAAEEAKETGRFYVYLLRGFDYAVLEPAMRKPSPRNWWSLGGAEAIQVGRVDVSFSGPQDGRATATFTTPELAPGTYQLMLCDAGCATPLGDVIPIRGFTIVADPATANVAEGVDRLERRIHNQAREVAAARRDAGRALDGQRSTRSTRSELEQFEARVSSLAAESRRSPPVARWAYAGWLVAGALVGALALLLIRSRRSRPSPPAELGEWPPSDEELRELLSSGPARPHGVAVEGHPSCARPIAQTAGTGRRSSTSNLSTENPPSPSRSASSFPRSRARSGAKWRASQKM